MLRVWYRLSLSLLLAYQLRSVQCFHYPQIFGDFPTNFVKKEQKKRSGLESVKALSPARDDGDDKLKLCIQPMADETIGSEKKNFNRLEFLCYKNSRRNTASHSDLVLLEIQFLLVVGIIISEKRSSYFLRKIRPLKLKAHSFVKAFNQLNIIFFPIEVLNLRHF